MINLDVNDLVIPQEIALNPINLLISTSFFSIHPLAIEQGDFSQINVKMSEVHFALWKVHFESCMVQITSQKVHFAL